MTQKRRVGTLVTMVALAICWTAAMLPRRVAGQAFTGDILGVVTDQSGSMVPNATVTLKNMATNVTQETKTADDGSYIFPLILPGTYEITATAAGFKLVIASNIVLHVGERQRVDLKLELGQVSATVEVTAAAALVTPNDTVVGQVITHNAVQTLPLNGRNFLQLAMLSPGVSEIRDAISPITSWEARNDMSIIVEGLRETDSSYLLDGVETRSPRWGGSTIRPTVDAIDEFNVQRNAFTADQGWGTTVVNTVLRAGSNDLHGSAYEFIRNDHLDARNFFDANRPPFKQNQFGGTVGGPIRKNKAFFFGSYEGFRETVTNTYLGHVPTQNDRNGIFSTPITDPETGQPFPNNTIPADRYDPVAKNVIPYWPAPNRPFDVALNYGRTAATVDSYDQALGRVDWTLPNGDRMFAHYGFVNEPLVQPSLIAGFGLSRPIADQNFALSHTHIFNPNTVNELHLGYNRSKVNSLNEGAYGPDLAKQIGLTNTTQNPAGFGLPGFDVTGCCGVGQGFTQTQVTLDQMFEVNDFLSYIRGKHTLKLGIDVRRQRLFIVNDFPSSAQFSFSGQYTGTAFADFLLGLPNFAQEGLGDSSANFRSTQLSWFVQDNYKVTPKLNLYFGLRYEYPSPYTEINNKQGWLNFATGELIHVGPGKWPRGLSIPDTNNFAPRFGFAYNPISKTVIRGGFGVFYDLVSANETQFRGVLMPPWFEIFGESNTTPTPSYALSNLFPTTIITQNSSPNTMNPFDRTPYVYMYNMNVQRSAFGALFEVGYVGSTGHKLNRRFNENLAVPGPEPLADRRPFPLFGDILSSVNNGWSNYDGLNVKVEKRYSKGLLLLVAYTYGKALDIGGPDEYAHRDVTGTLKDLRGPSSIDQRQRFVTSYSYDLPFGKGKKYWGNLGAMDKVVGGWSVTGITTFGSGHPSGPQLGNGGTSTDWANIGQRRIQPAICIGPVNSSSLRANIRNNPVLYPYFPVQNILVPAPGTLGNCGRNMIVGPGVNDWDMGFLKDTRVTERVGIQFRAEFFNIWNHAQFFAPDSDPLDASTTFGRITSAGAPREIQFGLKLLF